MSTGNAIHNDWVHAFKLTEGKISAFEGYEDSAAGRGVHSETALRALTVRPRTTRFSRRPASCGVGTRRGQIEHLRAAHARYVGAGM